MTALTLECLKREFDSQRCCIFPPYTRRRLYRTTGSHSYSKPPKHSQLLSSDSHPLIADGRCRVNALKNAERSTSLAIQSGVQASGQSIVLPRHLRGRSMLGYPGGHRLACQTCSRCEGIPHTAPRFASDIYPFQIWLASQFKSYT